MIDYKITLLNKWIAVKQVEIEKHNRYNFWKKMSKENSVLLYVRICIKFQNQCLMCILKYASTVKRPVIFI